MKDIKIGVVGLGYVGLPLAVEFKKYLTVGYDINKKELRSSVKELIILLKLKKYLDKLITNDYNISDENGHSLENHINKILNVLIIITVPTPVDKNKNPILNPLINSSREISKILKKGDYVVYESTVYPGLTEELCIPILEKGSKLKLNEDFFVGYRQRE